MLTQVLCFASNLGVAAGGQHVLAMMDPIYGVSEWLVMLVVLATLLGASEFGFRFGRRSCAKTDQDMKSWITTVAASVLGMLGLLLAFTMSMAVTRYDARRLLVLDEANAIGTSFWRAQLAPAPEGPEIANLLREYTELRIQFTTTRPNDKRFQESRERSGQLQTELWSRAAAFAQKDPRSVTAGLLLQTLNQTFDLEEARWIAFHAHVPESVIWVDWVVALLASALLGHSLGLAGRRNFFHLGMLAVCITLVMAVIVDLDDPRRGLIRVSQRPLLDVQQQMGPATH
jgi:hypothetical protein